MSRPALAGPKRPQDRVALGDVPKAFAASAGLELNAARDRQPVDYTMNGRPYQLPDGAVVVRHHLTNTSNPSVLMAAGLLATSNAGVGVNRGSRASLAPGSKVVSDYLAQAKLTPYLDELGLTRSVMAVRPVSGTPVRCRAY